MLGELTPTENMKQDDVKCKNCDRIIDELDDRRTENGEHGCVNCIENCKWCGESHFEEELNICPYYNRICDKCEDSDNYQQAIRNVVLKESLRCYFDKIDHKGIKKTIIKVTQMLGFPESVKEMEKDLKK